MASRPALNILPPECVAEIIEYLDLDTLKSLRRSSRQLCIDCTGPRFKKFIRCQTLEVTSSTHRSFRNLAVHPLGAAVRNLKILATVYDQAFLINTLRSRGQANESTNPDPTTLQLQADLAWMEAQQQDQDEVSYDQAVKDLAFCLGQFRAFDHIELDAVLVQGPTTTMATDNGQPTNWYPVFMRASRIYCMTMEAITISGAGPKRLSVYQATPRCSVPLYDIATNIEFLHSGSPGLADQSIDQSDNLKNAGKRIEEVSLSLSTKVATGATERPPRAPMACHNIPYDPITASAAYISSLGGGWFLEEEKFDGLARFLENMPNLKSLEIHFYQTLLRSRDIHYQRMFDPVALRIRLPLLRQCSLRGIAISEDSLLQFLSNHQQITDLMLKQVSIPEGSWEAIFAHLDRHMPNLRYLCLSTLRMCNRIINLHPVWERCPRELEENSQSQIYFVHTKVFTADELQKGLEFRPMPAGPTQGSQRFSAWVSSLKKEYGPPW